MSRQARTLVLLGALGLIAVIALGLIAKRYAALAEAPVSVEEAIADRSGGPYPEPPALESAGSVAPAETPADDAPAAELDPLADAPVAARSESGAAGTEPAPRAEAAASPGAPAADDGTPAAANLDPSVLSELEVFIATRIDFHAALDEHPKYVRQMKLEIDDRLDEQQQNPSYFTTLVKLTGERLEGLEARGMTIERYREIREMFRAHMDGEPVDPDWAAAFESRRETLEPLWFGKYEALDL